jgi:hypothetical protein
MEYVAIAFRSRSDTVKFSNFLRNNGYESEIINTPKEAGVGCGLCVKIKKEHYAVAKRAVLRLAFSSFAGFFLISIVSGKRFVRTI